MTPGTIGIAIALGVTAICLILIFIRAHVVVCPPNEAVIFSGRKRPRIMRGGRGFRRPLVETVSRISLNTIALEIKVTKALSKGMIPLNVEGNATVKVSGDQETGLPLAVERFLGKNPTEIRAVARQTVEGSLRGVIATMSPEEANSQRLELASRAARAAREDLDRLGLVLDTLKILDLADTQDYLKAIGKQVNAKVQRDAKVAEARASSEARHVAAVERQKAIEAETAAEQAIVDAENAVRVLRAKRDAEASAEEQVAVGAGFIAKAEQQQRVEAIKVERNRLREQAETVVPATARGRADALMAEGAAASIRENGRATADAIEQIRAQWTDDQAREIMLMQMLPSLLDKVTHVLHDNLHVERLTVVDSGDGGALPNHVRGLTGSIAAFFEQLKTSTGVDIAGLLQKKDDAA